MALAHTPLKHDLKDVDGALLENMINHSKETKAVIDLLGNQFRAFIAENNLGDEVMIRNFDLFTAGLKEDLKTSVKSLLFRQTDQGGAEIYLK